MSLKDKLKCFNLVCSSDSCCKNAFIVIIVLVILGCYAFGLIPWGTFVVKNGRSITVTGSSERSRANEIATFGVSISSTNAVKKDAIDELNDRSKVIIDAIKGFGIDINDIKTSNFSIYQINDPYYSSARAKDGDWSASTNIDIKLRNIERSSDLASLLATLDTSSVYGPNFTIDDMLTDEASLLSAALQDAEIKAGTIATANGYKLGKVISITEGSSSGDYYPMYAKDAMGGGGMPFEPGSTTIVKTVSATFELR